MWNFAETPKGFTDHYFSNFFVHCRNHNRNILILKLIKYHFLILQISDVKAYLILF